MRKIILFLVFAFIITGCTDTPTGNVVKNIDTAGQGSAQSDAAVEPSEKCSFKEIESEFKFSRLAPTIIFDGTTFGAKITNQENKDLIFNIKVDILPNGDKNLMISNSEDILIEANTEFDGYILFSEYELKESDKWFMKIMPQEEVC
ncbi:MAG: lipoprotein [Candidatus Woesearchaeota archaeon]